MGDPAFDLYLITDLAAAGGPDALLRAVQAALDELGAGVAVQLRDKRAPPAVRRELGGELRRRTRAAGAALFVNCPDGDLGLPRSLDADGVHLPDGVSVSTPGLRVACSAHDAAGLARAAALGADFATLGPVCATPGKGPPLGWSVFAALAAASPLPVVALGGMLPGHVPRARASGAAAVATIRGVLAAPDPAAAARGFRPEPS